MKNNDDLKDMRSKDKGIDKNPENRDPISGAKGAHPVGTGVGAAGAGAAGAAIGSAVGGPVGGAVGLVAGAVVGGLAGKGTAEAINPTREDAYWRENYRHESYVTSNEPYDEFEPAYRTGYEGYSRYGIEGRSFDEAEDDLRRDYEQNRGRSRLGWDRARDAVRAAWDRVERALPGDADHDGR